MLDGSAWLDANPDKIMVIKCEFGPRLGPEGKTHAWKNALTRFTLLAARSVYAPWCRACKSVEPKFVQISRDPKYANIPIIFGQFSVQHNKAYVKSLGIMALPSVQIYAGSEGLVENFPCGPSKIPLLKRKLTEVVNSKVDPDQLSLKIDCALPENSEAEPCRTRSVAVLDEALRSEIDEVISD